MLRAFIHIISSMFNQHAKWLDVTRGSRAAAHPLAQLSALFARVAPGSQRFSHQDPGSSTTCSPRRAAVTRVYLPPDANTLLVVTDTCLRSRGLVKRDSRRQAARASVARYGFGCPALLGGHRHMGVGEQRSRGEPDVGDGVRGRRPTMETLAAVDFLRKHFPDLRMRVVNVVDLMTLQPRRASQRPEQREFDSPVTADKPTARPRLPWLIHRLTTGPTTNLHWRY